ncbi:type II toxin-antitoxin system RelE/ParE family toxin [Sphingomonas naasensis]|uniref:Type II toxin-antitoxin system RelE/ParE family toxin n=1 Tax=Sphingomonas naasensis TaxID=1344951 RepID=A0A4S1WT24_9SPHN|nr:type II toxin-antitoxin system RelE/ParE family toxin [Sphingomonas naasensis]
MKLRVSRAAGRDLDAIYSWTLERWGVSRADGYLRSFNPSFVRLRENPELGPTSDIREGYRKLRHREHIVF